MPSTSTPSQDSGQGASSTVSLPRLLKQSLGENYEILSKLLDDTYGNEAQRQFALRRERDPPPWTLAYSQLMERVAREIIRERLTQGSFVSDGSTKRDPTRITDLINNVSTEWQPGDGSNAETADGFCDLWTSAICAYALLNVSRASAQHNSQTADERAEVTEKDKEKATSEATGWGWGGTLAATAASIPLVAATAYAAFRLREWYEGIETEL